MIDYNDIIGLKSGKLYIDEYMGIELNDHGIRESFYKCKCDCGNEVIKPRRNLIRNKVKSCGCINKERMKIGHPIHGQSHTRLYKLWKGMRRRCNDKNNDRNNKYYVSKGIMVCDEWNDFEIFMNWAYENGYRDGLSIDRIDNNKDYCPDNCRFVTMDEQRNNTSRSRFITFNGVTKTAIDWSRETGVKYKTIISRLNRGLPPEEVLK